MLPKSTSPLAFEPFLADQDLVDIGKRAKECFTDNLALIARIHALERRVIELEAVAPWSGPNGTVHFDQQYRDWRVAGGFMTEAELPGYAKASYHVQVIATDQCVVVSMIQVEAIDGGRFVEEGAALTATFNVNCGFPCLAISADNKSGAMNQVMFALPSATLAALPAEGPIHATDHGFVPVDAPVVVRRFLADNGFTQVTSDQPLDLTSHDFGRAESVVTFARPEKFVKKLHPDGISAGVVLMIEVTKDGATLSGGIDGVPGVVAQRTISLADDFVSGPGVAVSDLLDVVPAVVSTVRDAIQRLEPVHGV